MMEYMERPLCFPQDKKKIEKMIMEEIQRKSGWITYSLSGNYQESERWYGDDMVSQVFWCHLKLVIFNKMTTTNKIRGIAIKTLSTNWVLPGGQDFFSPV